MPLLNLEKRGNKGPLTEQKTDVPFKKKKKYFMYFSNKGYGRFKYIHTARHR